MQQVVHIQDFWPPRTISIDDFWPEGIVTFTKADKLAVFPPLPKGMGADAATVLIGIAERLRVGHQGAIELLTIMQFCENLLRIQGIEFKIERSK